MVAVAMGMRLIEQRERESVSILAIKAAAEEQTLPRICGLAAQFGVIPTAMNCRQAGGLLIIEIEFPRESAPRQDLLLAKLQALVSVRRASLVAGG